MWAAQYIGTPWEAGAQGPQAYDCMAFFGHVQRTHFGVAVPAIISPDYEDGAVLTDLFRQHPERDNWLPIDKPEHGCAVLVHRPMHIGIWMDVDGGGVLHCVRGVGVIFTGDSVWRWSGFGRREYFRHGPKA